MTKFKMTLKKSAAVLAAAALTISGLAGTGSFGGVLKNETEIVNAAYGANVYKEDYTIGINSYDGVFKKDKSGSKVGEFSGKGLDWDKDNKILTLTNFNFTSSADGTNGGALYIECAATIKLFGENTIGFSSNLPYAPPITTGGNLTIEGPGSLTLNGKDDKDEATIKTIGGDVTINNVGTLNCDESGGYIYAMKEGGSITINNSKVQYAGYYNITDGNEKSTITPMTNGEKVRGVNNWFINSVPFIFADDGEDFGSGAYLQLDPWRPEANMTKEGGGEKFTDNTKLNDKSKYIAEINKSGHILISAAPKDINEPIVFDSIALTNSSEDTFKVTNFKYCSLADVLTNIVYSDVYGVADKNFAKAWLNYAAAAQAYFGSTDKPANRYLDESDRIPTDSKAVLNALKKQGVTGVAKVEESDDWGYIGSTLILGYTTVGDDLGKLVLRNYYEYKGTETLPDNIYNKIEINNKTYYYTGRFCNYTNLLESSPDSMSTENTVYDYIYSTLKNSETDPKLATLCCALYEFGEAAKAAN